MQLAVLIHRCDCDYPTCMYVQYSGMGQAFCYSKPFLCGIVQRVGVRSFHHMDMHFAFTLGSYTAELVF